MKNKILPLLIPAVLIFAACRTVQPTATTPVKLSPEGKISLNNLNIRTANFSNLTVSINMGGKTQSSRASMKIICDSIIQISVQPMLGIELARLDITPTRFVVVDKFHGQYFAGDFTILQKELHLPVGYRDLEAMLLNRPFVLGGGKATLTAENLPASFTVSPFPDGVMLQSKAEFSPALTEFTLDKSNNLFHANVVLQQGVVRCTYSSFAKQQDDIVFPQRYSITVQEGNLTNGGEVSINNVEFNKTVKINVTDLSRYQQVDDIEKMIP